MFPIVHTFCNAPVLFKFVFIRSLSFVGVRPFFSFGVAQARWQPLCLQAVTFAHYSAGPWWKGNYGEKRGAFPAAYVKVIEKAKEASADGKDLSLDSLTPAGVGGADRETLPKALAKFDYTAAKPTELTFVKGETIVEVRKMAGEWWRGSCRGKRGYFPRQYVAIIGEGILETQKKSVFHSEKPPLARAMFDFKAQSDRELASFHRWKLIRHY